MKRFAGLSVVAAVAFALAVMPVGAQSRGGGSSRSGGGASHYGGGGGSRTPSSMSSSRGGGSYGSSMSRGGGGSSSSRSYSGGGSTRSSSSYSSPYWSSGDSQSRSRSGSYGQSQSYSRSSSYGQSQSSSRSGGYGQQQSGSRVSGYGSSQSGSQVRSSSSNARVVPQSNADRSSRQPSSRVYSESQSTRSSGYQSQDTRSSGDQPQRSSITDGNQSRTASDYGSGSLNSHVRTQSIYGQSGGDAYRGTPQRVELRSDRTRSGWVAPCHRDPVPFNRPCCFWDHGHHCFGCRVHYLPPRYHVHCCWGCDYYIIDGLYYRHWGDWYYVCRPPFGVFFDPVIDIAHAVCSIAYYTSVNNTFSTINENARLITEQNETIARNNALIAQQNETIAINNERSLAAQKAADAAGLVQKYADASTEYFYDDGVFFAKDKDGKYVTIIPPAGALVKELPEDYQTITLNGVEYYKVDDTVFRTSVVNGVVYFEVLGQMTGELADKFDSIKK